MPLRKKVQSLTSGKMAVIRKCRQLKEGFNFDNMASVFQNDFYVKKTSIQFNEKIKNDLARLGL